MHITQEDRILPVYNVRHITDPRMTDLTNNIRQIRLKFIRYNWIALAIYVGMFANLG